MRIYKYFLIILFLFILSFQSKAQFILHPYNLDFENGLVGGLPMGWVLPGYAIKNGYNAELTDDNPKKNTKCLVLYRILDNKEEKVGSILQEIDARQYRGKKIRFRAAAKAELISNGATANIWFKVHDAEDCVSFEDLKDNSPIVNNVWGYYEITATISDNAEIINYGLMLNGLGKAWIDDVSLEILDEDNKNNEPPASMTERGVKNTEAFAKLYGYIRHFYPGFQTQDVNWDKFVLNWIERIENAKSSEQLIALLNEAFKPIAPNIEIFNKNNKPSIENLRKIPNEALLRAAISKKHTGPEVNTNLNFVKSEFINIFESQREREASIFQVVDPTNLKGKKIRFSAKVKVEPVLPTGLALIGLRIESFNDKKPYFNGTSDPPITKNSWDTYSITSEVNDSASMIKLGLGFVGEGKAWFDDVKLVVIDKDNSEKDVELRNPGFEDSDSGKIVLSWNFPKSSEAVGYYATSTKSEKSNGDQSLLIYSDTNTRIKLPLENELYEASLNDDISLIFPLTNYADKTHRTLPHPAENFQKIKLSKSDNFNYTGDDRASRLAIFTMVWNVFKHFSTVENTDEKWNFLLEKYFKKVALDKNKSAFLETLNQFAYETNDDQVRVWMDNEEELYSLPILWKYLDNKLIITIVADTAITLKPGDVVISVNGKPVNELLKEKENTIPGFTKEWKILRGLIEIRCGEQNSLVKLKIESKDGGIKDVVIKRNMLISDIYENKPSIVEELKKGIVYADLSRLTDKTFKSVIPLLEKAKGIIFDARGNTAMTGFFLGLFADGAILPVERELPIFTKPDKKQISYKIISKYITPKNPYIHANIIFLIDERTYGSSEEIVSIAKHYHLGKLIGARTAGIMSDVLGFSMPGHYFFSMTLDYCKTPDGEDAYRNAVTPDVYMKPTIQGIENGNDELLEKAVEMLSK